MEKYTRFENVNDIICENHIIKLYGEELMMFKSFCDAVFNKLVKELELDYYQNKYYVNDAEVEPYGFNALCKYIKQRFGIDKIFFMHFRDGILRVKNYYIYDGKNGLLVHDGKNHV